jgi:DNA mismatch endonuclease (patch repair protein)
MVAKKKLSLPRITPCSPARSRNMSAIKSRGNRSTEAIVLRILKEQGCTGWRRHLPIHGTPDFAFPRLKLAIFVNGCFWHGCPKCFKMPLRNVEYWTEKIRRNVRRDRKNSRLLRAAGWSVMHIWEHSLRRSCPTVAKRISTFVQKKKDQRIATANAPNP